MKNKISALIVDDEPLARDGIRFRLEEDSDFVVVGEATGGREALEMIKKLGPDVVFLDIQMPELDGFGVVEALPKENQPLVVFVTAFDQYAVAAFEAEAVDYVLKPVNPRRIANTLERVKLRLREREHSHVSKELLASIKSALLSGAETSTYRKRFTIRERDRVFFVETSQIDWIGAENYYVALHVGKQTHLVREALSDLERQLDPGMFARIHRSSIVNISRIKELKRLFHGEYIVLLIDGTKLKLGRSYRQTLERILDERR